MSDEAYDSALDLLRRLSPRSIEKNLESICRLQPDLAEDLLSSVDKPITVIKDSSNGKEFLGCDYNRDGDNFRSPYSNKYYPDNDEEAPFPSKHLEQIEKWANSAFNIYKDLYYEGGISCVYLWDQGEDDEEANENGTVPFDGVVLIKKNVDENTTWDAIHVFEINTLGNEEAEYKLTSTIILDLSGKRTNLSGNLMKQTIKKANYSDAMGHIANIGSLIEDVETKMRNMLQEVYFGKTRDVVSDLRGLDNLEERNREKERREMVVEKVGGL